MATSVSFASDILPLFTQDDIDHMLGFGVNLAEYTWMSDASAGSVGSCTNFADHGNARSVYGYLTGDCEPQMPLGADPWSQDKLDLFKRWMDGGFQP